MPTGALAEEILTPGAGQIKALIVCGGNPLLAWPDQLRTRDALKALELLIVIDPVLSATARHAHYVLAPTLGPETETNTAVNERWRIVGPGWGYEVPYAQVCPPVLEPPPGADLREDWEFFYELARHMGLSLEIYAGAILDPVRSAAMATRLDMRRKPSALEAWRMVLKGSPVPYDEARSAVAGQVFPLPVETIAARPEGWMGRLELGAPLALERLAELVETPAPDAKAYPYRLISRRLNDVMNSCWHENPTVLRKWSYNPAFLHPDDLSALGLEPGAVLEIRSERGTIRGVAQAEAGLRRGCVSMSHSWGRGPDDPEDPRADGGNTGRLVSNDKGFDPITGMPRMSAIPVSLQRV